MTPLEWLTHALTIDALQCIPWPYGAGSSGYPLIKIEGRTESVHVIACRHTNGPRPDGDIEAAHLCHNQLCINGRHLHWATPAVNSAERMLNGTRRPFTSSTPAHGKLDPVQIDEVRARYLAGTTQQQLADTYGVSQPTISRYLHGHNHAPE